MIKSKFLVILEEVVRRKLRDPISLNTWLTKAVEHIENLEAEKPLSTIKPHSSTPIEEKETPNETFKREVEQTLLSSIAPEDYQVNTILNSLIMFAKWKNKKQKSVIAEYESLIRRAITTLRARKKELNEEREDELINTFMTEEEE